MLYVPLCGNKFLREGLLTLAVAAVTAEVAATGVFELAVAFGADADHGGHDCARYAGKTRRINFTA